MKILDIYKNINSKDDVIFQSREIIKELYDGDEEGRSFIKVIASEGSKREYVRNSVKSLKQDFMNINFYKENDEDVLDGKEEIINLLVGFLQVKVMQFIIENKEFKSKDHFLNYCWKASENKIIDKVRKLNREPSKESLEQTSRDNGLYADIYGERSNFLM